MKFRKYFVKEEIRGNGDQVFFAGYYDEQGSPHIFGDERQYHDIAAKDAKAHHDKWMAKSVTNTTIHELKF
jgi:hypothetical protein